MNKIFKNTNKDGYMNCCFCSISDIAQQHNLDRANLSNEYKTRQSIMTREIKQLRTEKKQQVTDK